MKRIVLTYGLISGAVLGVMLLISTSFADQIGFDRGAIVGYTSMVAAFVMIFFGIRAYRDQVLGFRDGVIDKRDQYAKVRGRLVFRTSESSWIAGQGNYMDRLKGPISPKAEQSPIVFGAGTLYLLRIIAVGPHLHEGDEPGAGGPGQRHQQMRPMSAAPDADADPFGVATRRN